MGRFGMPWSVVDGRSTKRAGNSGLYLCTQYIYYILYTIYTICSLYVLCAAWWVCVSCCECLCWVVQSKCIIYMYICVRVRVHLIHRHGTVVVELVLLRPLPLRRAHLVFPCVVRFNPYFTENPLHNCFQLHQQNSNYSHQTDKWQFHGLNFNYIILIPKILLLYSILSYTIALQCNLTCGLEIEWTEQESKCYWLKAIGLVIFICRCHSCCSFVNSSVIIYCAFGSNFIKHRFQFHS